MHEADVLMLANQTGQHGHDIAQAFACITPDEIAPVLARYHALKAKRVSTQIDKANEDFCSITLKVVK